MGVGGGAKRSAAKKLRESRSISAVQQSLQFGDLASD